MTGSAGFAAAAAAFAPDDASANADVEEHCTPSRHGAVGTRCVAELHLTPIVSVQPGTTLAAAARVMQRTGTPFVVVEGHRFVLAREDVIRAIADDTDGVGPDEDVVVMARSALLVVPPATPAFAVLGELVRSGAPGVIVIDDRRQPLGMLRLRDLVAALLDELALLSGLRHVLHVSSHGVEL